MCSVSYIPLEQGFALSHNRDELPQRRSSASLSRLQSSNYFSLYPTDLKAGGTWMGTSNSKWSLCLLNGGSVPYLRQLPYARSRGSVIPDFLEHPNLDDFQKKSFSELEPFTLILAKPGTLWQLQHDPNKNIWTELDSEDYHFWSSTKLYHPNIRKARERRFRRWLEEQNHLNAPAIRSFHLNPQASSNEGGLLLSERFPLQTVSFCQIEHNGNEIRFEYEQLFYKTKDQEIIKL